MLIGTFMSHVQHCMQLCFPYVHTHNTYTKHAGRWQSAPQRTEFKVVELQQQVLLGTMTVICRSVPLLLLIALATTTLGAHPVKGDASEGESTNTGGCISDWRGMKKAYLQHQSSADVENSIFDFYPSDALNYSVLVMFYDVGLPTNTSTSGRLCWAPPPLCSNRSEKMLNEFSAQVCINKYIHIHKYFCYMYTHSAVVVNSCTVHAVHV